MWSSAAMRSRSARRGVHRAVRLEGADAEVDGASASTRRALRSSRRRARRPTGENWEKPVSIAALSPHRLVQRAVHLDGGFLRGGRGRRAARTGHGRRRLGSVPASASDEGSECSVRSITSAYAAARAAVSPAHRPRPPVTRSADAARDRFPRQDSGGSPIPELTHDAPWSRRHPRRPLARSRVHGRAGRPFGRRHSRPPADPVLRHRLAARGRRRRRAHDHPGRGHHRHPRERPNHPRHAGGRDPATDLAVLRLDDAAVPRSSGAARRTSRSGGWCWRSGRPGPQLTASMGIISAVGGEWRTWQGGRIEHFVRLDLAIYDGFCGGPLVEAGAGARPQYLGAEPRHGAGDSRRARWIVWPTSSSPPGRVSRGLPRGSRCSRYSCRPALREKLGCRGGSASWS